MNTVFLLFCEAEDFDEFRRVCDDREKVASTHADYSAGIEDFCNETARLGGRAVKVRVKPAELAAWCRDRGLNVDAGARAHYASLIGANLKTEGGAE